MHCLKTDYQQNKQYVSSLHIRNNCTLQTNIFIQGKICYTPGNSTATCMKVTGNIRGRCSLLHHFFLLALQISKAFQLIKFKYVLFSSNLLECRHTIIIALKKIDLNVNYTTFMSSFQQFDLFTFRSFILQLYTKLCCFLIHLVEECKFVSVLIQIAEYYTVQNFIYIIC